MRTCYSFAIWICLPSTLSLIYRGHNIDIIKHGDYINLLLNHTTDVLVNPKTESLVNIKNTLVDDLTH